MPLPFGDTPMADALFITEQRRKPQVLTFLFKTQFRVCNQNRLKVYRIIRLFNHLNRIAVYVFFLYI